MRLLRHWSLSGAQALNMRHRADAVTRAVIIFEADRMGQCKEELMSRTEGAKRVKAEELWHESNGKIVNPSKK